MGKDERVERRVLFGKNEIVGNVEKVGEDERGRERINERGDSQDLLQKGVDERRKGLLRDLLFLPNAWNTGEIGRYFGFSQC